MITIIHGDNTATSRKFFIDKKGTSALPILGGEKLTLIDIKQQAATGGLFERAEPIFVEGFISNSKSGKNLDEISDYFKKHSKNIDVYFWEKKELTKKQTSLFGVNVIVETFKIPKNTFGFLDSIRPENGKRNVELFHEALTGSSEELLFFMLIRQFRLLLVLQSEIPLRGTTDQIDEVKRLAPWQKSKFTSQAKLFSSEKLTKIYKKLNDIDLAQKTGGLTMPLKQTIDIFLLDI